MIKKFCFVAPFLLAGSLGLFAEDVKKNPLGDVAEVGKKNPLGNVAEEGKKNIDDRLVKMSEELQKKILKSTEAFKTANTSTSERLKKMDAMIVSVQEGISSLGPQGELSKEIDKNLTSNQELVKKYKSKTVDPSVPVTTRNRYDSLIERTNKVMSEVYDKKNILSKTTANLQETLKTLVADRDFIIDSIAVDDAEMASQALSEVISHVADMESKLSNYMDSMKSSSPSKNAVQ